MTLESIHAAVVGETDLQKVLVVDDQPDVREALRLLLKGAGYAIETVATPGEALAAAAYGGYHLIIVDMNYTWDTTSGEEGLRLAAESIEKSVEGIDFSQAASPGKDFRILIENTAGSEFSLGGSFEQVAEILDRLRGSVPIAACIDTCHTHVAGYDIVSQEGLYQTLLHLDATIGLGNVRVVHCNDAKAARGSKLDRHQQIGKGTIGKEPFRILLNDLRLAHAAFIAETPIEKPGDDRRNIEALKKLVI